MCKLVADLVGADKREVREIFERMELQCGNPNVDLRLTGEIYGRLHMKMRELGLDPNDTTPHELYQALLNIMALHDSFLVSRLGIENPQDTNEISTEVAKLVNRIRFPKNAWALKAVAAKRLLKALPPKALMKQLNYRSIDSMLKRESATILLAIARHIEATSWQEKFVSSYKKVKPNDFQSRDINVEFLSDKRWTDVGRYLSNDRHSSIIHTPEVAEVILLPIEISKPVGLTITSLLLTLHYINEIRVFSTFSKFHHMHKDFGGLLVDHLHHKNQNHVLIAGQPVHWKVVHKYYGSSTRLSHPELFQPHVQPEDLAYRKAEDILFRLEPALHFWFDSDYLGMPRPDGPISFGLTDMAMNLVNGIPYENRIYYHMQESLWNEIYSRYLGQSSLEKQILTQLEGQSMQSEQPVMDMEFVV